VLIGSGALLVRAVLLLTPVALRLALATLLLDLGKLLLEMLALALVLILVFVEDELLFSPNLCPGGLHAGIAASATAANHADAWPPSPKKTECKCKSRVLFRSGRRIERTMSGTYRDNR
jgi:hypothetical protein